MRRFIAILALLASATAYGQHVHIHPIGCDCGEDHDEHVHEGGETVRHRFVDVAPRFGLAWQSEFFAEVGLSVDIYRIGYTGASEFVSFGYRNIRPYVSGEIMLRGDKSIYGPKAGLEFIMSSNIFGMAVGADATWYTDGRRDAVAITPRLLLSFVYVEIYYGYNFFVRNDLEPWLGHHRVGVSMVLNPRFWKRKKAIYEDYYNSYLE